jgi:hypothetical protein
MNRPEDKIPIVHWFIIVVGSVVMWYWGYYVAKESPEFNPYEMERIVSIEQGTAYPRICNMPCVAFSLDQARECGEQICRDDYIHHGGKCR